MNHEDHHSGSLDAMIHGVPAPSSHSVGLQDNNNPVASNNHNHNPVSDISDTLDFHSPSYQSSSDGSVAPSLNNHTSSAKYEEVPSTSMNPIPSGSNGGGDIGGGDVGGTSGTGAPAYDDMFPALPDGPIGGLDAMSRPSGPSYGSTSAVGSSGSGSGGQGRTVPLRGLSPGMTSAAGNKMKVRSTNVTQVFKVAPENRRHLSEIKNVKVAGGSSLGGSSSSDGMTPSGVDQAKICRDIMTKTGTVIELCNSKDGTLTFLITGKEEGVASAKRLIGAEVQTQTSTQVKIPKSHHRFILGKSGKKLTDLQDLTGTKISIPRQDLTGTEGDLVKIVGTKEGIEKAVHEMMLISHEIASKSNERLAIEVIQFFTCLDKKLVIN